MYILSIFLFFMSVSSIYGVNSVLSSTNSTEKPVVNPVQFKNVSGEVPLVKKFTGREGEVVKLVPARLDISANSNVINTTVQSSVSSNGMVEKPNTTKPVIEKLNLNDSLSVPSTEHHGKIVPKKGVILPETPKMSIPLNNLSPAKVNNTNSAKLNATDVPKKPLFTESDDDNNLNLTESKEHENVLTIDQIDPVMAKKKSNRSDYVVLIVAVILSVPLIAFLMSVIYKRSQDWWQHRYYKRMDFLIEGMYHN